MNSKNVDLETIAILSSSIESWCKANKSLMDELESQQNKTEPSAILFKELDQLGVLNILCEHDRSTMALVVEAAYQFAPYSPSIALMLVQQNMASYLLADSPTTWVALPLYDAPVEWPFR